MEKMVIVEEDAGAAVREVMELEGINQSQLADLMQVNRQSVQQSLNRRGKTLRVSTLNRMLKALGYRIVLAKC